MNVQTKAGELRIDFQVRAYPQVIKYMGSKAKILDFVLDGLRGAQTGRGVCDLFAGACSLSGAIGNQTNVISNDIQKYSGLIAHTYLHRVSAAAMSVKLDRLQAAIAERVEERLIRLGVDLDYPSSPTLNAFNQVEERNRALIDATFGDEYHLFLKNYSGTWWSARQCAWIDALREACDYMLRDGEINNGDHAVFLTCVMHAMAYCGQGTGHYAQYRDAKDEKSLADIMIYRQKSVSDYFFRKLRSVLIWNQENVPYNPNHTITSLDYRECLQGLEETTVYADPPYAFVHYSRFYHAIETFTLYDYPELQIKGGKIVKGRYRDERHQSPFSIRSQVAEAFEDMFDGARAGNNTLVLSYSNTALLDLPTTLELACDAFGPTYTVEVVTTDHQHMTMGRRADRLRDVEEALIIAKRIR